VPYDELVEFLQSADAIILYYPPSGGAHVCSASVDLAFAVERPVVVSDTEWFQHCRDHVFLSRWADPIHLSGILRKMFINYKVVTKFARTASANTKTIRGMSKIVDTHEDLYKQLVRSLKW
jgi:hypothetical protein